MKKIFALVLAMMLVLGMTAALADVPTSQTIANNSAAPYVISVAPTDTHTYKAYQILTGTLIAGQEILGNPVWGSDAKTTPGTNTGVDTFITSISASGLSNVEINDLVKAQLSATANGSVNIDKDHSLTVAPGYYLIEDITTGLADGDAKSLNIVAVFNDIQIAAKKGTTTSNKHVDDVNDSAPNDHSELKDSADYDIGDDVPYTLTFTLPADYGNYKKYYVSFVDDMSAGLTYNGDAHIWYGTVEGDGDDIGAAFAADANTASTYTGGTVYKYTIADLKTGTPAQRALTAGNTITIKYTAKLNASAVIGAAGNPNKYKVDFSSNPNQSGDGTPETNDTPWDINIVFTFKTVFNKVDPQNNALAGADFKLEKKVNGAWVDVTALHTGSGAINPTKTTNATEAVGTEGEDGYVPATAATTFTFAGLDAGDYKLTETATPTGYNTIDPIEFTITATHDLESDDPKLQTLTGTDGHEFNMTTVKDANDKPTGELDANIINRQGNTLPSTGGVGTTIFYIGGSILVLAAVIFLVTKRRMNANND